MSRFDGRYILSFNVLRERVNVKTAQAPFENRDRKSLAHRLAALCKCWKLCVQ